MNFKHLNRYIALALFIITLFMYRMTVQSSVSFWDCGEYAATSPALMVPHPPGAPLFTLIGRIAMMTPYVHSPAMRFSLISGLTSALTIMLLYLIGVRIISMWNGFPSDLRGGIVVFGSAAIGALTLAVSDSFWYNATEADLFATAAFFIALIVWLGMIWYEKADEPGSQKYLLLASYAMGLSIGVHILSLIAFFPVAVIVYFRYYEFSWKSFAKFAIVALLAFFIVYPGIVKYIAAILHGDVKLGPIVINHSPIVELIPPALVIFAIYMAYKAQKAKRWILNSAFMAGLFIVLGFTTYAMLYIRSNAQPPINEDNPSTLKNLVGYLNRDQYGSQPIFWPREWSNEPRYQAGFRKYGSNINYFFGYQLDHMYLRYLGWNFIGRAGDVQNAPVTFITAQKGWYDGLRGYPARYYAIPFLLGLFGCWYLFKRNWKFGVVFMTMFLMFGLALVVYFNMEDPQPRERFYFFVGSFFVFSLWCGIGVSGIIDLILPKIRELKMKNIAAGATAAILFAAVPGNMFEQNFFTHDRLGNFAPFDYSYNILQSCKKNAILFTNGDNDTFPLWYLQQGLGIRTDVRIVNLSLANTNWYDLQLKNQRPDGAEEVPISMTDQQLENIQPIEWKTKTIKVPVPKSVYKKFGVTDTSIINKGYMQFTLKPTLHYGSISAIRAQDLLVESIVEANHWKRPIYFSVTVAPGNFDGLTPFLKMEGLALQLTPVENPIPQEGYRLDTKVMRECFLHTPKRAYRHQHYGFLFTNLRNPNVYYDNNVRMLSLNYRYGFMRLAEGYAMQGDTTMAIATLDSMQSKIPTDVIPLNYKVLSDVTRLYYSLGATKQFHKYGAMVEKGALAAIKRNPDDVESYYNPYRILLSLYQEEGDYQKSISLLEKLQAMFPGEGKQLGQQIEMLREEMKARGLVDTSEKSHVLPPKAIKPYPLEPKTVKPRLK